MENNEELQKNKNEIESLLSSAKSDLATLEEIKNEATNIRTTLRGRDTESENKLADINRLQTSATQLQTQIQNSLNSVAEIVTKIKAFDPTFEALKIKVEDADEGVEALCTEVAKYRDSAANLKKEAGEIVASIQARLNDVEQIKEQATQGKNDIKGLLTESESMKDSISEHLELVTDSSLHNAFKEREKDLVKSVKEWKWYVNFSFLLLALATCVIFYYVMLDGVTEWREWFRFLFAAPFAAFVVWCVKNHSAEKRLLDRYADKAVVSASLSSYVKLLTDRFGGEEKEILTFTKDILKLIFKEPFEDKSQNVKGNVSLWNVFKANVELDAETKAEVKKKVETAVSTEKIKV